MMTAERRRAVRAPVSVLGALETDAGELPMLVLDLSISGARIQTDGEPDLELKYTVHFTVHNVEYHAGFRVVRSVASDGTFHWGGSFEGLAPEQVETLRRAVDAAAGIATLVIREWADVEADAAAHADEQIVVGFTPAGHDIRLSSHDCLDMGQEGVALFVHTVANLERT